MDKLLLLLFLLSNSTLLGQLNEEHFIRFGKADGLPSDHIYGLMQDSDGFLWISTENGVSRYNGYEFENFDILDGLTDNEVFGIHEDSRGRLWMRTFSGVPCYYLNGEFHNPSNTQFLKEMKPSGFFSSFLEDANGNVYLSCKEGSIYKVDSNNIVKDIGCREKCRNWGLLATSKGLASIFRHSFITIVESPTRELIDLTPGSAKTIEHPVKFLQRRGGEKIISAGRNAIIFNQDWAIREAKEIIPEGRILEISESEDGSIYLGTTNGLFHFSKKGFKFPIEARILKSRQCQAVLDLGREGRWVGTSKGLYYQPLSVGIRIGLEEGLGRVTAVQKSKETLLVGTEKGNLVTLSPPNYEGQTIERVAKEEIQSIYLVNRKEEWIRSELRMHRRSKTKLSNTVKFTPRDIESLEIDSVCYCFSTGWKIKPINYVWNIGKAWDDWDGKSTDGENVLTRNHKNETQCFEIHYTADSTLWVYDALGIHTYEKGIIEDDSTVSKLLETSRAVKIESSKGAVFFATNGVGLVIRKGTKAYQLTKESGLLDNKINDIYPDPVHGLWVAYSRGIQRLNWSDSTGVEIMNLPQGTIPAKGKEIIQVVADSTHLFVLTETSVFRVEKAQSDKKYERLTSQILNVTLNDTASLDSSQNDFAHYENSFQFDFIAISFRAMGNIQYRYRLNGLEERWSSTKARFAKYPSIPPGSYEFEVQAKVIGEEWGESTFFRTIRVLPPYWETWWFRLAIILGFVFIAVIVLLLILRSNRRRNLLIQQTMLAKHKALITQMNPHFIFNSLNSIQRFFITNDLESANDYLVDFGNLIRIILENGRETNITLEKEVTLLDLYMKMEALRMRQKFDFKITHDGLDLAQVVIPPMLLQPFVENAIWHGVAGLKGHGHISIQFEQVDDRLCVEIEDNGVGRPTKKVVKKGKSSVHQSLATRITKERIDLMKSDHPDQVLFKIVDLKDENNRPRGTLVKIQMPFETQTVIGGGLKNESNINR